jgi:hypothetical protein
LNSFDALKAIRSASQHVALGKYSRHEFCILTDGDLRLPNFWRDQPFALSTLSLPPARAPVDGVIDCARSRFKTRVAMLLDEQTHS